MITADSSCPTIQPGFTPLHVSEFQSDTKFDEIRVAWIELYVNAIISTSFNKSRTNVSDFPGTAKRIDLNGIKIRGRIWDTVAITEIDNKNTLTRACG